jgi:hypothetical protein
MNNQTILEMLQEGHQDNMIYRLDISYNLAKDWQVYKFTQDPAEAADFVKGYVNREAEGILIKIEKYTMEQI